MGLLDRIKDTAESLIKGSDYNRSMFDSVVDIFKSDGFKNIINKFKDNELGHLVESWISKDDNEEVTEDDIRKTLGDDVISNLADKVGVSEDKAIDILKDMLPDIIDGASPDGILDDDDYDEDDDEEEDD